MTRILSFLLILLIIPACAIDPYTGEEKVSNTAKGTGIGAGIGAASGAIIGAIAGGGKGAAIGAGIGAGVGGIAGAGYGYHLDTQEKKLRLRLENTGVRIVRNDDNIRLIMPGNIVFATNSSRMSANFYPVLDSIAIVLQEYDESNINVVGFTDSSGSFEHNQKLSEQRAASVSQYLISSGITSNRLQTIGLGERHPIAPNDNSMGRQQNRRVEVTIR